MHHFNVAYAGDGEHIVERSTDGAGWMTEFTVTGTRQSAEGIAKAMKRGVELEGGKARITSMGRDL